MVLKLTTKRNVRVLLVGERGVGKTTIILSLVSEEYPEEVPAKAEEITIPADVTPEKVPTHIVDYSDVEQTDEELKEEVNRAHVICVVYSVDDEKSFDKVTSKWLPFIKSCSSDNHPIVLVGNKVDLVDYSTIDSVYSIMEEFPEIECCIECSAKTLKNISELFYFAQKAVLHPTSPLYMMDSQDLTESCKHALCRIFKVCDVDNDGLLNDSELNAFQYKCFNVPLPSEILEDLKAVLRKNISDGVSKNCITLRGFLFLHCLFIQRGRNETTWTVLRKFGYNDNLEICSEYLFPPIKVPMGCTSELSHKGHQFFFSLFERHDKDNDGALCPSELLSLFSPCPRLPWGPEVARSVLTNSEGWITLQGFMCQWVYITLNDLPRTLEYLAYLGYNINENENQLSAIQVTREKRLDLAKKQTSRNVYQCHVIGPEGCGKSMFCRSLIGKSFNDAADDDDLSGDPLNTINMVQVYGQEKYLILRDIDICEVSDPLFPSEVQCDVACLMYDIGDPKSFEFLARIYLKYFAESKIPVLIVANKSDLEEVKQDYLLQPATFCNKHKLPPPQPFNSLAPIKRDIFVKLATMAAFPRFQAAWVLFYRNRHLKHLNCLAADPAAWWKAGLGIAAATAVGFLVIKVLKADKR